ncbi:sigma-54 interaction domain-containing protein [Halanaerobium hydrogeniformans]|uniref:Sigma54 specific transcriptional regulator, Fis family n=1 Tax=Halanaerobium hydrogeniformans TaxID=656519 RepID=E4RM49_HALHG|nr:sigma 54-interacting transcriptional regulator [Halanaerobium hydrogeniformans]ADQ14380.1 sigma54 specific transcriptional regulator, Fis family [Halanaerobium hydrogeniformans]
MNNQNSDFNALLTNIKRNYTPTRKTIQKSWARSGNYGIKTDQFSSDIILNKSEIRERIKKNKNFVENFDLLFSEFRELITELAAAFFVTDKEGYILSSKNYLDNYLKLSAGENYSEFYQGTSAVGLTLFSKKDSYVKDKEHYKKFLIDYNSAAYPLLDKAGILTGTIAVFFSKNIDIYYMRLLIKLFAFALTDKIPVKDLVEEESDKNNPKTGSKARYFFEDIITNSKKMKKAKEVAKIAARNDSTVMLIGESGTGKEMFAQAIHNYNHRKNSPFVAINVGAVPKDLVESEFFGYEEGAFTGARRGGRPGKFELANGGTIFLDEIGEMTLSAQQNLLRVIQEREVTRIGGNHAINIDVRIITATKKKLMDEVKKGNFREDLYYRLNVIRIPLPNLKERKDDVILLVKNFIKKHCQKFGIPNKEISDESKKYFINYDWPGNVRELENVIEGIITFAMDDKVIQTKHLPREIKENKSLDTDSGQILTIEAAEKEAIKNALKVAANNVSEAAEILGVTRATLYNKLKKYNINYRE